MGKRGTGNGRDATPTFTLFPSLTFPLSINSPAR
jgi:hypothetical protein